MSTPNWPEAMVPKPTTHPAGVSPVWVGLAFFLFFPLGFYLLWKYPEVGRRKSWWLGGAIWGLLVLLSARKVEESNSTLPEDHAVANGGAERPNHKDLRVQGGSQSKPITADLTEAQGDSPTILPFFFDEVGRRAIYLELREGTARIEIDATERFGSSTKEDNLRGVLVGDKRLTEKSRWQMRRLTELYQAIEECHKLPDGELGSISKEAEAKGW